MLEEITDDLVRELAPLRFAAPVTHVYNPLDYAREAHFRYLERYGRGRREIVLLGMNPGPFGMAQTGVPFGEVAHVRDWLGIEARVAKPSLEHPKRKIAGFACARSEVSGARIWSWAKLTFGTPEKFFARFFVVNYCPLAFMEETGRNRTPDKLAPEERRRLFAVCDRALGRMIDALAPALVVGVGAFAEARAREALAGRSLTIGRILHPSPASPAANADWAKAAASQLKSLGVRLP